MKAPQVLLCAFDNWLADQLRSFVAERGWLLREGRQVAAWQEAAAAVRVGVAILQANLSADGKALAAVSAVSRGNADLPVIVVSDTKMSAEDRAAWTLAVLDVSARLILFPPLTRSVLEDAVGGLMDVAVSRVLPVAKTEAPAEIDLAGGHYEAEA